MPSDIRDWLSGLALARYAEAFEANDLDLELVRDLDDDDLRELGVHSMGHRKTILRAIAGLGATEAPGSIPSAPAAPAPADTPEADAALVEHRQLTVMFCDIVGSTALSNHVDAETLHDLLRAYQDVCARQIARYDGYLAKYMGDGVLAYFGWPRGHEDDAELAVKASLDIIEEVGCIALPDGGSLSVRAGIATGPVLIGDIVGEGLAREATVTGAIPNLAARLQSVAGPDTVIVDATSHLLLGGLFEFEALGPQALKGFDHAVEAWRVLTAASPESRFDAVRSHYLAPCIGRGHEFGLLEERWRLAREGEGQVVLLSGEAGIGKSRLTHELMTSLAGGPQHLQRFQCSPYHTSSALNPFIDHLERRAGFAPEDDDARRLARLEAMVRRCGHETARAVALVASLLSLPFEQRFGALDLTPQKFKQSVLEVLADLTVGRAAEKPVLFVFEDAHWIDPTSLELLELIVARAGRLPVLVIITHRPDWHAPFFDGANTTLLRLNRLGRLHVAEIIRAIAAGAVPDTVIDNITSRSDGIPLFVEEIARTALDAGMAAGATGERIIPSTLQASLTARLDHLSRPAREMAQVASVIGREASLPLLRRVVGIGDNESGALVDELMESRLVDPLRIAGDDGIVFRHALVRDGAYQSLLTARRREIHRAVADVLAGDTDGIAETQPELVAQHYAEAGVPEAALDYWRRAGDRAAHLVANNEAIDLYRNALTQLARMPEAADRVRLEVEILLALGVPLIGATGYASDEVRDNYARAGALARTLDDGDLLFTATRGLWNCIYDRGDLDEALDLARRLARLAEAGGDTAKVVLAQRALGSTLKSRGALAEAVTAFETCIAAAADIPLSIAIREHGEAPQIVARQYLGWTECLIGNLDRGIALAGEAARLARELNHPITLDFALHTLTVAHLFRREYAICRELGEEMSALSEEHAFVFWTAGGKLLTGCALTHLGETGRGLAMAAEGIREWRSTGAILHVPTWTSFMVDAALDAGAAGDWASTVAEVIAIARANNDLIALAELQRLEAGILLRNGETDRARAGLEAAIATARDHGALLYELRATTDLARIMAGDGAPKEAHARLAPVYERFREGLDCRDLAAARALLATLYEG